MSNSSLDSLLGDTEMMTGGMIGGTAGGEEEAGLMTGREGTMMTMIGKKESTGGGKRDSLLAQVLKGEN